MEGDFIRQRHSLKMSQDFNPRPPWGGRRDLSQRNKVAFLISIHALRGEGDDDKTTAAKLRDDFNPRPPWGGRHIFGASNRKNSEISIHALRGEGDRPPRAAREPRQKVQSTPSVGRATYTDDIKHWLEDDFNPRPPWGGRPDWRFALFKLAFYFNPRPPWGGRPAPPFRPARCRRWHFNPRPPWGGRRQSLMLSALTTDFNPRPPWGGRR